MARSIDLNQATKQQLLQVPGIDPRRAEQILDYRRQRGGFRSVEELTGVPGFSPELTLELRHHFRTEHGSLGSV